MRPILLSAVVAVVLFSATAQAQTLVATSNIIVRALDRTFDFTSDTTTSVRDSKVVLAARDDAASLNPEEQFGTARYYHRADAKINEGPMSHGPILVQLLP